jgi:hypothetical protein
MAVKFVWHSMVLSNMLTGRDGEVAKDVQDRATKVLRRLQRTSPVLSGTLKRSWKLSAPDVSGDHVRQYVESDAPHVWAVERGRKRVFARPGSALAIPTGKIIKLSGRNTTAEIAFRRSAKAVPATRFVEAAVADAVQ